MILITSGAYLVDEFISEVGFLPPSFLPIGNQRLYNHQIDLLRQSLDDDIYLSYPESYNISAFDKQVLESKSVTLISVPDGLSLGESIIYSWQSIDIHSNNSLSILHGDTLFLDIDLHHKNCVSIHDNKGFYRRGAILENSSFSSEYIENKQKVLSGYFSFFDAQCFIDALNSQNSNFVAALSHYTKQHPLKQETTGKWLDFGHINSFFQARSEITTQRAFNALKVTKRYITKSSNENTLKIKAEGRWFENLPKALHLYTPALLDLNENFPDSYKLEYLYLLPLSDLMVFCALNHDNWKIVLKACKDVLDDFSTYKPELYDLASLDTLYLKKTTERLMNFQNKTKFNVENKVLKYNNIPLGSLFDIMNHSASFIRPATQKDVNIVHGDFCFSNILFDSRVQSIKLIDPRGIDAKGDLSIYGDRRYDLAKLYHSLVGFYDFIIADCYELTKNHNDDYKITFFNIKEAEQLSEYCTTLFFTQDYEEQEILAITIHLFLSMLPLHYDRPDRQEAFIANALRLYATLIQKVK